MASAASARLDLEAALIKKCWQEPDFRKQVVADPKGMLEKATGQKLPDNVKIFIHEEDRSTLHLSIPPAPKNMNELSDEDLERVAGGTELVLGTTLIMAATMGIAAAGGAAYVTKNSGW
jgi:hypothetical protein